MFFAEYIRQLHCHISLGTTQPVFTEDFLCHVADGIKELGYSLSRYKQFFSGKTKGTGFEKRIIGDEIGPFAVKHLRIKENEYKKRLSNLQIYLAGLIKTADAASEIANAFRTEIPDISSVDINTLAERLSELYFTIIRQIISAELRSKGGSVQKPKNGLEAIPSAMRVNINEKINEIVLLIEVMLELGKEISTWQDRHTMSTPYSKCPVWQLFHEKYDRYHVLSIELRALCQKYSIKLLESAIQLSEQFTADSFWRCYPTRKCRTEDTLSKIVDFQRNFTNVSLEIEESLNT